MIQIRLISIVIAVVSFLFIGYTYYLTNKVSRLEAKSVELKTSLQTANENIKLLKEDLTKVEALQSKQTENRVEKTTETIYIQEQKDKAKDVVKTPVESSVKINKDFKNITNGIVSATK